MSRSRFDIFSEPILRVLVTKYLTNSNISVLFIQSNGKNQEGMSSSSAAVDGSDTVKRSEDDGKNTVAAVDTSITDIDPPITQSIPKPIVSLEEFFHDEPDLPWQPLPAHTLEQSPCHPIIVKKGKFYHCKLHP